MTRVYAWESDESKRRKMKMRAFESGMIAAVATAVVALALSGAAPPVAAQEVYSIEKDIRVELDGAYLGIEMEDVTADSMTTYKLAGERGVVVRSVMKGSPAEAAGLQERDVVLEFAGTAVTSAQQMRRLVRETPVGRKVDLVVSRDGKKVTLDARIGKREGGPEISEGEPGIMMFGGPGGPSGRTFHFRTPQGGDMPEMPGTGPFVWEGSSKPRLGVTLQPLTDQLAEFLGVPGKKGVLVTSIVEGSPAVGKLKAGDVIVRADNQAIEDLGDLTRLVRGKPEGGKLELKVVRDKKEIPVTVDLSGTGPKPQNKGYKL
jgi:serine protease Do